MRTPILRNSALALILTLTSFVLTGCGSEPASETPATTAGLDPAALVGTWRAVLASPGGELPFTLKVNDTSGTLNAIAVTGPEEIPFSSVEIQGEQAVFHFEWYDSEITTTLNGADLQGTWRRTSAEGANSTLAFTAQRDSDKPRFLPPTDAGIETVADAPASIAGNWAVEFTDEDGTEQARGEFEQNGNDVNGTFLTPTGDYRFLEGSYEQGVLRLSTFDGAHAFLFQAKADAEGNLTGDFWSRDTYHATWTARPLGEGESVLPDAWAEVGLTNDEGNFSFAFDDIDGKAMTFPNDDYKGKVVIVNIFGSWCPNCNDEAPFLAKLHKEKRDQGLEIVGLAYEFTGDVERDREMVRRFGKRYGIEYPLLLAGLSDKAKAAETLPDLTAVLSYPTTIFIGRDGRVRKIHSGFSGPGTGEHYERLVAEMNGLVDELLAESS